jgi:hypothetical protein
METNLRKKQKNLLTQTDPVMESATACVMHGGHDGDGRA